MTELDGYGNISTKNIILKTVGMEAQAGGSGGTKKITLNSAATTQSYALKLPINSPIARSMLMPVESTSSTDFLWKISPSFETGSTLPNNSAINDGGIYGHIGDRRSYYSMGGKWYALTNFVNIFTLDEYEARFTQSIYFDTFSNDIFLGSGASNKFSHIDTESLERSEFTTGGGDRRIVANINDVAEAIIAPPHVFNNLNVNFTNDTVGISSNFFNNGVIVQKQLSSNNTGYVEWEFMGGGTLTNLMLRKARFGFIQNDIMNTDTGNFTQATVDWGYKGGAVTGDGGVIGEFRSSGSGSNIYANGALTTQAPTTFYAGDWNLTYGDSIQVYCNGVDSFELIILKRGHKIAILTVTGLTITKLSEKRYYMSLGHTGCKFRLSKKPSAYQGTLTPEYYVLALANA